MPKNANSKLRIIFLLDLLKRSTDAEHGLSMEQLITRLRARGVEAERKTIYDDIEKLRSGLGYDIEQIRSPRAEYRLLSREFEDAELRLLADAVCASRFITAKKSAALIKKLEQLTSEYTQSELSRQILVDNRIKTMNESIYYNVDALHNAIRERRRVRFHYFDYNTKKERVKRRNGELYELNPLALSFSNDNYYLIAYNDERAAVNNYRVDRMLDIEVSEQELSGEAQQVNIDVSRYESEHFSMFDGELRRITLVFDDHLANVAIDRFGRETTFVPRDNGCFSVNIQASVGPTFFGWLAQFGTSVKIESPPDLAQAYREHLDIILKNV